MEVFEEKAVVAVVAVVVGHTVALDLWKGGGGVHIAQNIDEHKLLRGRTPPRNSQMLQHCNNHTPIAVGAGRHPAVDSVQILHTTAWMPLVQEGNVHGFEKVSVPDSVHFHGRSCHRDNCFHDISVHQIHHEGSGPLR